MKEKFLKILTYTNGGLTWVVFVFLLFMGFIMIYEIVHEIITGK
jgi:uncharacterized BrkB/YihY/UPF0761 family membrane protein